MKKVINNFFGNLSSNEIKHLTAEVNETIALGACTHTPVFTRADLWNIQRISKFRPQRRFL